MSCLADLSGAGLDRQHRVKLAGLAALGGGGRLVSDRVAFDEVVHVLAAGHVLDDFGVNAGLFFADEAELGGSVVVGVDGVEITVENPQELVRVVERLAGERQTDVLAEGQEEVDLVGDELGQFAADYGTVSRGWADGFWGRTGRGSRCWGALTKRGVAAVGSCGEGRRW